MFMLSGHGYVVAENGGSAGCRPAQVSSLTRTEITLYRATVPTYATAICHRSRVVQAIWCFVTIYSSTKLPLYGVRAIHYDSVA